MLKYLYCKEVFAEVPDEISLAIGISGCQIRCPACHSRELWEDKGIVLGLIEFQWLLNQHPGITCVCLLGGEHDIDALTTLFMYAHQRVKTAWYCGLDMVPRDKLGINQYLDYLKLGHYDQEFGGLDSPTTNQKFWKIDHIGDEIRFTDITSRFQSSNNNKNYE